MARHHFSYRIMCVIDQSLTRSLHAYLPLVEKKSERKKKNDKSLELLLLSITLIRMRRCLSGETSGSSLDLARWAPQSLVP